MIPILVLRMGAMLPLKSPFLSQELHYAITGTSLHFSTITCFYVASSTLASSTHAGASFADR